MIKEPDKFVIVKIQNNRTGIYTQPQTFDAPKPGMVTIWELRTVFKSDDISLIIDWPMKVEPLIIAGRDFVLGWKHFLDKINWEQSSLDAEAVQFMNEVPGKIAAALSNAEEIEVCKDGDDNIGL